MSQTPKTREKRHPKAKRWATRYYIAVDERGNPIVRDAQIPIYWRKNVAAKDFEEWGGARIKRCSILIEP